MILFTSVADQWHVNDMLDDVEGWFVWGNDPYRAVICYNDGTMMDIQLVRIYYDIFMDIAGFNYSRLFVC